jgi:uncharacterized alkaline shock family protein YloU
MIALTSRATPERARPIRTSREDARGVPTRRTISTPGRSLVSRRAVVDIVRAATLGSYGVVGLAGGGPAAWLADRLGIAPRGIRVDLQPDGVAIELDLIVGHGLPVAEVARQVDSAVRYAVGEALGRKVDRLAIHVGGLRLAPFEELSDLILSPAGSVRDVTRDDLAASGTDVA